MFTRNASLPDVLVVWRLFSAEDHWDNIYSLCLLCCLSQSAIFLVYPRSNDHRQSFPTNCFLHSRDLVCCSSSSTHLWNLKKNTINSALASLVCIMSAKSGGGVLCSVTKFFLRSNLKDHPTRKFLPPLTKIVKVVVQTGYECSGCFTQMKSVNDRATHR